MKCPFCNFKAKYKQTVSFQKTGRFEYRYMCLKCTKYPVHLWFDSHNQLKDWRCNFEPFKINTYDTFKYAAFKINDTIEIKNYRSLKIILTLTDVKLTPQQVIDKFYSLAPFL